MKKSFQFLLLGLIWILFCIPVVTIGAATCAVFYVGIKIQNNDQDIKLWKLFIKGLKENFVQGLLMELISIATIGGITFLITWTIRSDQSKFVILLAAGVALVILIFNAFAYPIIGRYQNTFSNIMRNTIIVSLTYLTDALRLAGILVLEIALDVLLFRLNLWAGLASLLFWPSVIFYTISFKISKIFYKVEHPKTYEEDTPAETPSDSSATE